MSMSQVPERLEAADVEAWVHLPGRRIVWFHAVWDGQGTLCLAAYRDLPLAVREIIPLRLVDMDSIDHPRAVQWDLRHASEVLLWENGRVLWRGVPQAGPGRNWATWLEKWRPV